MKQRNFVAKHAATYNKAATHIDRKKAAKAGKMKHKKVSFDSNVRLAA